METKLSLLNISIKISSNQEFKHAVMYFEKFGYKLGFRPNPNTGNDEISFVFLNKTYNPYCIDRYNRKYHNENVEVDISELGELKLFKIKQPKWKSCWKE